MTREKQTVDYDNVVMNGTTREFEFFSKYLTLGVFDFELKSCHFLKIFIYNIFILIQHLGNIINIENRKP